MFLIMSVSDNVILYLKTIYVAVSDLWDETRKGNTILVEMFLQVFVSEALSLHYLQTLVTLLVVNIGDLHFHSNLVGFQC